jgi:hypothetical protein
LRIGVHAIELNWFFIVGVALIFLPQDWTAVRLKEEIAKRLKLERDEVVSWKLSVIAFHTAQHIADGELTMILILIVNFDIGTTIATHSL